MVIWWTLPHSTLCNRKLNYNLHSQKSHIGCILLKIQHRTQINDSLTTRAYRSAGSVFLNRQCSSLEALRGVFIPSTSHPPVPNTAWSCLRVKFKILWRSWIISPSVLQLFIPVLWSLLIPVKPQPTAALGRCPEAQIVCVQMCHRKTLSRHCTLWPLEKPCNDFLSCKGRTGLITVHKNL